MNRSDADMLARRLHEQRAIIVSQLELIDDVLTRLGLRGELVSSNAKTLEIPQQSVPPHPVINLELQLLAGCWDGCGLLSLGPALAARLAEVVPLIHRLASERGLEPVEWFRGVCSRFKSDPAMRTKRFGLRVLLSQLEQWADPPSNGAPPPLSRAQREYQDALLAAEELAKLHPDQDWSGAALRPAAERIQRAKEALDQERGTR